MRALTRLLLGAALIVLLASCRVDATVDIEVTADGSGTVSAQAVFDPAASEALQGLEDRLFVSDLAAAGWAITRPEVGGDGTTTITASKDVPSRDQFQVVLDELAGVGVFRAVEIDTVDAFAEHRQSLHFDIDLSDGWDLFADEGVTEALGGEPFGVPIDELTNGRPIDEVVGVTVTASVTGDDGETPSAATFAPRFDDTAPTEVRLDALLEQSTAVLLRWIAYALASLFVLSLLLAVTGLWLQRRADRLRPQATPTKLTNRIPGAATASTSSAVPARSPSRSPGHNPAHDGPVRLVVVEPLSVLYQQSGPADEYLLPFVRHNGGDTRADVIIDSYEDVLRGRIDTTELWQVAGIPDDADTDQVFMKMRWLRKEVPAFLKELQRKRIPIAAVTNDASAWSSAVRERDRLTAVWPWLVSSEIGALKPDPGIFELLRRETGTAYGHCLYLDTDIANLDAARELGMRTALFNADDRDLPAVVGHPVVKDLTQLLPKR